MGFGLRPLSQLPRSSTFSANGEAWPGRFFLKFSLHSSTFSCLLLLHTPLAPCTPSCLCFVLVRHPGMISPEVPVSISLDFLTQEVVLHSCFSAYTLQLCTRIFLRHWARSISIWANLYQVKNVNSLQLFQNGQLVCWWGYFLSGMPINVDGDTRISSLFLHRD